MAKKKETTEPAYPSEGFVTLKEFKALQAQLKEQQQAIESFRASFQNFDTKFKNLIERNRLR